jgi:NitT/TauT family transport system substrate-binding protein
LAAGKITIGYFPNVTHAAALVGVGIDAFTSGLPGIQLDYKTFNAGPTLVEAVFGNAVDVGYVGPSPAVNGHTQSQGQALKIVAGAMSGGASFVVRPGANIAAASDLDGKRIASPQRGNTQDIALRYYLKQHQLKAREQGGSVDIVPTSNPDIVNLFKQGQIDGAWVPEPWASTLVLRAGGRVLEDERTLWPDSAFVTTCVIATPRLVKDRPDIVSGFLKAHVDAVAYIRDNPADAQKLVGEQIARITSQSLESDVLDRAWSQQDVTYDPLVASVRVQADNAFALGFLGEARPDLGGLFELGLLNDVLRAAGQAPVAAA